MRYCQISDGWSITVFLLILSFQDPYVVYYWTL